MKNKILILICIILLSQSICGAFQTSKKIKPKRIMIDMDGVLNNYSKYSRNSIPEIRPGAKEFIEQLSKDYILILFTSRNTKQAMQWLIKNDIDKYFYDVTSVKRPADIYLDDRAIQFNGNYNKTLDEINSFQVYWN